ncbi:nucleotidyltransferase domain-containing protein [Treponema succinifaciens]|uniref:nucleotidyltransferase domain-containing protein n=2 Tax=Treponema TaxID=157 RepID=UPI002A762631|nr:nucleotidyltransferase domain-containing protein [Treponema succinifaciens]MDY2616636.1 nucleotidyltransferase domain-containing protein [Treponema succinifaciens]
MRKISADKKIVVYESRAEGNFRKGSDIDLTILDEEIPSSVLLKLVNDFDGSLLPTKVDISIFLKLTIQDLIDYIKRVGQFFYQK